MTWDRIAKAACAAVGAVAGLFGEWNALLTLLVVVMTMDYLSGLVAAAAGRSPKTEAGGLSSKAGFIGLAKKGFILLIVLLGTLLDGAVGNSARVFQTSLTCYYIANEGLSILENAARLGVPFPGSIRDALETMKTGEDRKKGGGDA